MPLGVDFVSLRYLHRVQNARYNHTGCKTREESYTGCKTRTKFTPGVNRLHFAAIL